MPESLSYWLLSMDLRPLLRILSDGQFHSGEQLGRHLLVSRSAVWKQVEQLRGMGVEVHSITGKGYRLPVTFDLLSRDAILSHLDHDAAGWGQFFELLFSTGSTNVEAMRIAQAGADRYVLVAEHQTSGRGRRGRAWISPLGANIYLSMVVSFQSGISALEGLSLAVALYVVKALHRIGVSGLGVKWPNDILLEGRKLAGILLEVSGDLTGPCKVVIGVGLNIKMPCSVGRLIDQPYTDLSSHFSGRLDRNKLVADIVRELTHGLEEFAISGFTPLRPSWDDLNVYKGSTVEVRAGNSVTFGRVKGVSDTGALLLETDSGLQVLTGGELMPSLRLLPGGMEAWGHDS